ncbi:MAG TPA: ATP-binding protein [Chitinophaga sp.]|uniref:ATP-binding response regulator n=1 Tax=Chitinophaga sp. TaxID=1869181 RepID=UPI002C9FFD66|nr:ATP-binding protein [Chitinophaga sp.]HVI49522.1 ATP-binding protein [Chitinophaga sp.]
MRRSFLLFITSLVIILALLAYVVLNGFNVHRKSGQRLLMAADTLSQDNPGLFLMDSALIALNDAESNFRLFTVTYQRKYLQKFSTELGDVLSMVDTISGPLSLAHNTREVAALIKKKEEVSEQIGQLKQTTDSMLNGTIRDDRIAQLLSSIPSYNVKQVKKDNVTMDTVNTSQPPATVKKSGFFKRLGNAFSNKGKQDTVKTSVAIMVKTKTGKVIDKETYDKQRLQDIVTDINSYYKRIIKQQLTNRMKINNAEQDLALTNIAMLEDMKEVIVTLKAQLSAITLTQRESAHTIVNKSVARMRSIAAVGLMALLLCLLLVVVETLIIREDRRKLDAGRSAAVEQARVRTDFLTNMSHEIRTPLNSIVGFTEQLSFTQLDKEQRDLLRSVEVAADMLMQVVNDVLDFSKLEKDYISIQRQPFVLYSAFNDVVNTMRVQAVQKNLQMNVHFEGSQQWQVSGDVFRLKQILLNLISNAIKYTEKGSVTVTAKLEKQSESRALFSCTVTDTGEGISLEAQSRLFERFYQASNSRSVIKGTGLGLAITKRLVQLHGGDITFTSELGKGTQFVCHIPYEIVTAPLTMVVKQRDLQAQDPASFMEGRYVLVAEDQEMNLLLLKMMLTRWKCRFDMATDGAVAIELFEKHQYDLVLLDHHMPKMSGAEVAERIRKDKDPSKAGVVILALTANISEEDVEKFKKVGFNDWLMKPFREKDIYNTIMKNFPLVEEDQKEEA